jgi:glycosyltransferase involved in cell wall biosynthesis
MKLSAVIITFNEERNIGRCLNSLEGVADEILVVDSFSQDSTREICENAGVRFLTHPFEGHIEQKNYAMEMAAYDWVLSLDADEALDDTLKNSILEVKANPRHKAYRLNRLTYFCGQWIRYTGWYPDRKIRLWHRSVGAWGGQNPHDRVVLKSDIPLGQLKGDLLHFSFYTLSEHVAQIQKFSGIAAEAAYRNGKRASLFANIILGPFYTFFKKFILQRGFLDGYFGFVISINTAYSKFLKYIKLREIQKKKDHG